MKNSSLAGGKSTYVALLRGINLGGHKIVKMDQLRKMFEEMGFAGVKTYIQSGNVVFNAPARDRVSLAKKIEEKIVRQFGFPVPVLVKTAAEVGYVVRNNPLVKEKDIDISRLHVTFLLSIPERSALKMLDGIDAEEDRFCCAGEAVYLYCPNGYHATKLGNNVLEKMLKVGTTTRNWKTVNQLFQMTLGQA
jgi:uncharacterized protein (DUF1697 family)